MIDVYIIETLKVLDAMDGDPNAMIFARSQFRKLAKAEGLRDAAKMGRLVFGVDETLPSLVNELARTYPVRPTA